MKARRQFITALGKYLLYLPNRPWVKFRGIGILLFNFPDKQTFSEPVGTSQSARFGRE